MKQADAAADSDTAARDQQQPVEPEPQRATTPGETPPPPPPPEHSGSVRDANPAEVDAAAAAPPPALAATTKTATTTTTAVASTTPAAHTPPHLRSNPGAFRHNALWTAFADLPDFSALRGRLRRQRSGSSSPPPPRGTEEARMTRLYTAPVRRILALKEDEAQRERDALRRLGVGAKAKDGRSARPPPRAALHLYYDGVQRREARSEREKAELLLSHRRARGALVSPETLTQSVQRLHARPEAKEQRAGAGATSSAAQKGAAGAAPAAGGGGRGGVKSPAAGGGHARPSAAAPVPRKLTVEEMKKLTDAQQETAAAKARHLAALELRHTPAFFKQKKIDKAKADALMARMTAKGT